MPPKLGLDIGKVIWKDSPVSGEKVLMPAVISSLSRLQGLFGPEIYLVSNRPRDKWESTTQRLTALGFFDRVLIPPEQICYCTSREEKALIAHALGITHFVDNRFGVLRLMTEVPHRFLFWPNLDDAGQSRYQPTIIVGFSWPIMARLIAATFDST